MRWVWIDQFLEFERGTSAKATKNLSLAEDFFADHFPGYPLMPCSLMIEGLAQTGGILIGDANDFKEKVVLAKINHARFHRDVLAGETLTYDVKVISLRPEGAAVQGKITSGSDLVGEAEIFFAHLDQSRSQQVFGDHNFVFTGELKHLLGLAKVAGKRNDPTH